MNKPMLCITILTIGCTTFACGGIEDDRYASREGALASPPTLLISRTITPSGITSPPSTTIDPSWITRPDSDPICGNRLCEDGETCHTCPADCDSCCGNGRCDFDESWANCRQDCPTCGNGVLDRGEQCDGATQGETCQDIGTYDSPFCGSQKVGCKSDCTFDTSSCGMLWPHWNACLYCSVNGHCFDESKGVWACREPDGSCEAVYMP